MIIDELIKSEYYRFGSAWKIAFEFLCSLSPDSEEKIYLLRGDDIYAHIASYETRTKDSAALESHRKYIDVQAILTGREKIEVTSTNGLVVNAPYDQTTDVEFFDRSNESTQIDLYPGTFAMFFPHDAHMPGLVMEEKSELVKKVVVKIKKELLTKA